MTFGMTPTALRGEILRPAPFVLAAFTPFFDRTNPRPTYAGLSAAERVSTHRRGFPRPCLHKRLFSVSCFASTAGLNPLVRLRAQSWKRFPA